MGKHSKAILDTLVHAYEKSIQANPFQECQNNRRISYLMKKYKDYDVQDLDAVTTINQQLYELAQKDYIQIDYHKEHTNHIVRVSLVLQHIDEIYQVYYGRVDRKEEAKELEQRIMDVHEVVTTHWIQQFLKEEMVYLKSQGWVHAYIGKDMNHIRDLLKVLCYVDQGNCSFIRTMSVQLFQNTKYFETEIKRSFLSVVRRYEDTCRLKTDVELVDSDVFRLLGFTLYPEVIEWCGHLIFYMKSCQHINTSVFTSGYQMSSDTLSDIECFDLSPISRVILIENKASYYHMIQEKQEHDLIIYAGGHFSPVRKLFYDMLSINYDGEIYLWSDIDLGGFLMYARLKRDVFSNLEPYAMDVDTYLQYITYGKQASEEYLQRLRNVQEQEELQCFHDVIDCILIHKKTLEQEAMMIA